MTHFAGKAVRVLFFSAVATVLLAATAFAAEIGTGVGAITGSSVRLRSSASTSASVLTTLDKGTAVSLLGESTDGWYAVAYNGYTGYVSADFVIVDQDGLFTSYGRVNADDVNTRSAPSTDASCTATLSKSTIVTVNGFADGWYSVTCQYGTTGYIRSDFLDLTASASSGEGNELASLAKQYLGTRYVYGGASPRGFDCSGFTMYLYSQFGVSLPHTATGQWQSGAGGRVWSVSELRVGDLVFFCDPSRSLGKACSHAGIYIGNGQIIHASSANSGVIISDLTSGYYYNYFVGGMHIL